MRTSMENGAAQASVMAPLTAAVEGRAKQFLTFRLQGKMFGLDIRPIKEIIQYAKVTSVPLVQQFMRGVFNLRGKVVPVVDLPMRFGWPSSPVTNRSCIVIIEVEHEQEMLDFGLVIDSISEVLELADADIQPPPSFGAQIRTDFIAGMGKLHEEFIVLLNANMVLSVDELSMLGQLAEPQVSHAVADGG